MRMLYPTRTTRGISVFLKSFNIEIFFLVTQVLVDNPKDDEVDRTFKRQTMIERLLGILDTAAAIGKAPTTEDFIQKKSKVDILCYFNIVEITKKVVET